MRSLNLALGVIITVSYAALLGISITTTALGAIKDGTSDTVRYSGPRVSIAVSGDNIDLTW